MTSFVTAQHALIWEFGSLSGPTSATLNTDLVTIGPSGTITTTMKVIQNYYDYAQKHILEGSTLNLNNLHDPLEELCLSLRRAIQHLREMVPREAFEAAPGFRYCRKMIVQYRDKMVRSRKLIPISEVY